MPDAQLLELLDKDIHTCQQLLDILEQEFNALNERKLEQLQLLLDKKQPLLLQLSQSSNQRSNLLRQQGLSADNQGFEQLTSKSPIGTQLTTSHQSLSELLERCQNANMRNGRLIRANQTSVNSALNIIRGGQNEPSLYDKLGSTQNKGTPSTFTKA